MLGITHERVGLPDDVVGRIEGKSSLGRLGLLIHSTAGFVDPGWRGRLTLELANILSLPITLYAGMPVAQISFMQLRRRPIAVRLAAAPLEVLGRRRADPEQVPPELRGASRPDANGTRTVPDASYGCERARRF